MVAQSQLAPAGRERPKIFRPWEDGDEESNNKNLPIPVIKCCGVEFKKKRELKRHSQATARHGHQTEKCPDCEKQFTRKDNLTRHRKMKHATDEKPKCQFCTKSLSRRDAVQRHEGTCHSNPNRQPSSSPSSSVSIRNRNSESLVQTTFSLLHKPTPIRFKNLKAEYNYQ